ncbi:hypothetical protein F5Y11DRAFT_330992 [Daldinia sp. FL1419]|nr:hypothetical protein F5Y11DRAFT_330992 [Daldinia sp. FL1419]
MIEVKPDTVCINGHLFRINYDVPQHITDRLYELAQQDNIAYEDIPDDLKEYEIHNSAQ